MTSSDRATDAQWMRAALDEARAASAAGEVPVGAVVVYDGQIIGVGRNAPVHTHDPSAHAEMIALRDAAQHRGNYRLEDCELFVTLEPCIMCAGAMLHARLKRVVFGATDPKTGSAGSVLNVFAMNQLNHHTHVQGGLLAETSAELLQQFFKQQRAQQQLNKVQAGGALREDALRTPESRFTQLPELPQPACYVNDLPSLAGLRLHYIDTGPTEATQVFLCLHSLGEWSYAWRAFAAQGRLHGLRVICPDLIGFGRSDKPKKASAQTLQWHAQVLQELIERLILPPFTVRMPAGTEELARLFIDAVPHRVLACKPVEGAAMDTQALAAPFPDAGHQAALRALISPKIQVASKASEKSKK